MPNMLESVLDIFRSLTDEEPKMPMHVGEVMSCWTYLTILAESIVIEQSALNMTVDPELRDFIEKVMAKANAEAKQLTDFLQREGVPLPPVSEPKPFSDPNAVPLGVKSTDDEIANAITAKLVSAVTLCATSAAECVRNDIALMFIQFQTEALTFGTMIKTLMRKRGWLKIPPYYYAPGVRQDL